MEYFHLKLLKRAIGLLEAIDRKLDRQTRQIPDGEGAHQQLSQEVPQVPFLVSNKAEITVNPELIAQWNRNQIGDGKNQQETIRIQRESVRIQNRMLIATIAAFVVTVLVAGIYGWQLWVMQRQLHATMLDQRPWIVAGSVKVDDDDLLMTFHNVGKQPTHGIIIFADYVDDGHWQEIASGSCKKGQATLKMPKALDYVYSVLPNVPLSVKGLKCQILKLGVQGSHP